MHPARQRECKEKPHYFEMFLNESIVGGNTTPLPVLRRGLGDWLEAFFQRLGIRPRKGCECNRRKQRINRLWFWMADRLKMMFGRWP